MDEPIICKICGGRIQDGEPVVTFNDGLAHRFSTTCDWFLEQFREQFISEI